MEPIEQRLGAHGEDRVVSLSLVRVGVAHGPIDDADQCAGVAGVSGDGADHGAGERGRDRLRRGVFRESARGRAEDLPAEPDATVSDAANDLTEMENLFETNQTLGLSA